VISHKYNKQHINTKSVAPWCFNFTCTNNCQHNYSTM